MAKKTPTSQDVINKSGQLNGVCQKAQRLIKMRHLMSSILPLELQAECTVANYRTGTLILHVQSAAWSTRLRMLLPSLLKRLKLVDAFNKLVKIEIKVRPNTTPEKYTAAPAELSRYGSEVLKEIKENLKI
jgi:hypothetical protein